MPLNTKRSASAGAIPAEALEESFPKLKLPIQPPYPPMEAKPVNQIPSGDDWQYEPKWDGFRCLAFSDGNNVVLQSKAGQPLGRYFPELVKSVGALSDRFVLDGEIVIERGGHFSFDDLLMRIHPAESRIRKLSSETPAMLLVFDILVDPEGRSLIDKPLSHRRQELMKFFARAGNNLGIRLSPASLSFSVAERWLKELAASGFDGVIAKRTDAPYASGERTAMQKVKRLRTADCVVGGFRWASKGGQVGSLLLGLYDDEGKLNHVGFTSSFNAEAREKLKDIVKPYMGGQGFTGRAPGGPSRWSTERTGEWEALEPKLVCEVRYDHFSGERFRHGTKFLRWRPEKKPKACTFEQLQSGRGSVEDVWAA